MEEQCVSYFKQYKKYAKAGYADAMSTLAELYLQGYGTKKDKELSLRYYRRAAKYGSVIGTAKTGLLYLSDQALFNKEQGIKYLKKAARNKHGDSAYVLGVIYSSADYGVFDLQQADKWLAVAYHTNNQMVRKYINQLTRSKIYSAESFPKVKDIVVGLMQKNQQQTTASKKTKNSFYVNEIVWPEDDIEVITVSPPTLLEIMDDELLSFRNGFPDKFATATGTKITSRTCDQMLSCSTTGKKEFKDKLNTLVGLIGSGPGLPTAFLKR